jgi:hypothetical protein
MDLLNSKNSKPTTENIIGLIGLFPIAIEIIEFLSITLQLKNKSLNYILLLFGLEIYTIDNLLNRTA